MKKILKLLILPLIIQSLLMGQVNASSRVDALIEADRDQLISELANTLNNFKNQKTDLENLEQNLRQTSKGQSVYLKVESIASGVIIVGIVIGSYRLHFPPGFRAMVSAYVTVTGVSHGLIKLSAKDVKKILSESVKLHKKIGITETGLYEQLQKLCKQIDYNPLCYE